MTRLYNTCMFLNFFPSSNLFSSNNFFSLTISTDDPPKGSELTDGAKNTIEFVDKSPSEKRNILRPYLGAQVDKFVADNRKTRTLIAEMPYVKGTRKVFIVFYSSLFEISY